MGKFEISNKWHVSENVPFVGEYNFSIVRVVSLWNNKQKYLILGLPDVFSDNIVSCRLLSGMSMDGI